MSFEGCLIDFVLFFTKSSVFTANSVDPDQMPHSALYAKNKGTEQISLHIPAV